MCSSALKSPVKHHLAVDMVAVGRAPTRSPSSQRSSLKHDRSAVSLHPLVTPAPRATLAPPTEPNQRSMSPSSSAKSLHSRPSFSQPVSHPHSLHQPHQQSHHHHPQSHPHPNFVSQSSQPHQQAQLPSQPISIPSAQASQSHVRISSSTVDASDSAVLLRPPSSFLSATPSSTSRRGYRSISNSTNSSRSVSRSGSYLDDEHRPAGIDPLDLGQLDFAQLQLRAELASDSPLLTNRSVQGEFPSPDDPIDASTTNTIGTSPPAQQLHPTPTSPLSVHDLLEKFSGSSKKVLLQEIASLQLHLAERTHELRSTQGQLQDIRHIANQRAVQISLLQQHRKHAVEETLQYKTLAGKFARLQEAHDAAVKQHASDVSILRAQLEHMQSELSKLRANELASSLSSPTRQTMSPSFSKPRF